MKFLFLNWKDEWSPDAGGAEVVHTNIINRLVGGGHQVVLLTQHYAGSISEEFRNGYKIIRVGRNRYTHTFLASNYYRKYLKNMFDIVVSCNNTAPYWACLFKGNEKHFALYHQLAREVWWYESKSPLNYLGFYILEPIATWLQAKYNPKCITMSGSTKKELIDFAYNPENIFIISEGIDVQPVTNLSVINKYSEPTILFFGAMREMKRPDQVVKAFEIVKGSIPNARLKVAGSTKGDYARSVLKYIQNSQFKNDIEVLGRVSEEVKLELMQKSHIIVVTSVKEGWGLVVTEANSQGTPACVYDVDGLRDSTKCNETGLISENSNILKLAENMVKLLSDKELYNLLQKSGYEWSKQLTFDVCYQDFYRVVSKE